MARTTGPALAACGLALAVSAADAQTTTSWRVATAFPRSVAVAGPTPYKVAETVNSLAGGRLVIEVHEPNSLVPVPQTFDAVANGSIDAGYAPSLFWAGKDVAYNLFSAVPFGPGIGEYLAWMYHGGGLQLQDALYAQSNLKAIMCGVAVPEAAGWFKGEIRTIDDLKGLKMRFSGLGAQVMSKLGVSTQLIPPGEIYAAFERGTIDATEFSHPASDLSLRLYEIAKYYYFPGWHQQVGFAQLLVNLDKWQALSDGQRLLVETACKAAMTENLAEGEAIQGDALKEIQAKGVQIGRLSPEILGALEAAWQQVAREAADTSEAFRAAWSSYTRFREDYAVWKAQGHLP